MQNWWKEVQIWVKTAVLTPAGETFKSENHLSHSNLFEIALLIFYHTSETQIVLDVSVTRSIW